MEPPRVGCCEVQGEMVSAAWEYRAPNWRWFMVPMRGVGRWRWHLPGITHLVPEQYRSPYVFGDAARANPGNFLTLVVSVTCLGELTYSSRCAIIFAFGAEFGELVDGLCYSQVTSWG